MISAAFKRAQISAANRFGQILGCVDYGRGTVAFGGKVRDQNAGNQQFRASLSYSRANFRIDGAKNEIESVFHIPCNATCCLIGWKVHSFLGSGAFSTNIRRCHRATGQHHHCQSKQRCSFHQVLHGYLRHGTEPTRARHPDLPAGLLLLLPDRWQGPCAAWVPAGAVFGCFRWRRWIFMPCRLPCAAPFDNDILRRPLS